MPTFAEILADIDQHLAAIRTTGTGAGGWHDETVTLNTRALVEAMNIIQTGVLTGATRWTASNGTTTADVTLMAAERVGRRAITITNTGSHPIRISPESDGTPFAVIPINTTLRLETQAAFYTQRNTAQDGSWSIIETWTEQ